MDSMLTIPRSGRGSPAKRDGMRHGAQGMLTIPRRGRTRSLQLRASWRSDGWRRGNPEKREGMEHGE